MKNKIVRTITFILVMFVSLSLTAGAHCDTMDGPVVKAAKVALERGEITPVLRWIKKEYEGEVKSAFKRALDVRTKGKEAQELADIYFFETVVRLHRAGEGESYTGLKPSGTPVEPIVAIADKALETGKVKELTQHLTAAVEKGIAVRFDHALEAKKEADKNVEAGREFVEAYVKFVHYSEQISQAAERSVEDNSHNESNQQEHPH